MAPTKNKLLLAVVTMAFCRITASITSEVILNSTEGMIYMDSFVAHEKFYSTLQELIKNKVKSAIVDVLDHSKVDITQLIPNIDVTEYTTLQILYSLAQNDLPFVNQLVESLKYRSVDDYEEMRFQTGAISDLLKSNVAYSRSEMYKVAKSFIQIERERFIAIPRWIEERILFMMNKSEIFTEASRKGDIDVMKWILQSENYLDLSTALDTACLQKRIDIVRLLIENDRLNRLRITNVTNCNKETLLHTAVQVQSLHLLSQMIRDGVSVNSQDARGFSPLYLAVKNNNSFMSKLLVEKGANVNQETIEGNTALHEAFRNGMVDIAELLINSGSNAIHKNKYGISPIMLSEKYVITNIVRYLFNYKVNIPEDDMICSFYFMLPDQGEEWSQCRSEQNIQSKNILRISELVKEIKSRMVYDACEGKNIKAKLLNITMINLIAPLVQSLINLDARLNVESTATKDVFFKSVESGNEEMTTLLLNKGISVNTTKDGVSALHIAAINGHTKIFHLLMERGANIFAVRSNGRSILHSACEGQRKEIVEYLIKRGLDVNMTDSNGFSPLQVAANNGNYNIVTTLVKYGANVRFRSSTTALLVAVASRNIKVVNFLLENGADIEEIANGGLTPFLAAVTTENVEMVEALLNRGASVHAKTDGRGDTALHIAARKGSFKMTKMLLKKGLEIEIKNSDGKTPLDEAIAGRHTSIINLLIKERTS